MSVKLDLAFIGGGNPTSKGTKKTNKSIDQLAKSKNIFIKGEKGERNFLRSPLCLATVRIIWGGEEKRG